MLRALKAVTLLSMNTGLSVFERKLCLAGGSILLYLGHMCWMLRTSHGRRLPSFVSLLYRNFLVVA